MLPHLVGNGPAEFSTSVTLVPVFRFPHDTNGYYRELGVSPFATREELRKAYQRKRGWRSTRLTYILKQLLDPEVRRKYDAVPMGSFFFDDYIEEELRRARMAEVVEYREQGEHEIAEALRELPIDWMPHDDDFAWTPRPSRVRSWPWSYYQWGTVASDVDRLEEWRTMLITALNARGRSYNMAVGFVGHAPCELTVVGYRVVAFLGDGERPTEALAEQVADRVIHTENL